MRITPSPAYNTTLGLGFEGTVRGCMKLEANSLSGSSLKAPPQMGAAISPSLRSLAANMASIHEESPPHLQLEIKPVRPKWTSSHQAQSSSNSSCFIWQTPANAAALDTRGNIDVNKIPSSADCDGDDESSPTGMFRMRGITHNKLTVKREREGIVEVLESRAGDVSSRGSDEEEGGGTRKKLRLAKEQSALLEECFKQQTTLNPNQKVALAKRLNLRPRQVEVWFQNRRARTKLKQTEVNYELLKRCCQSLTEENRKLQSELQELRAIKVASSSCVLAQDLHSKQASTRLIMCPSCEHLSTTSLMPRKLSRAACN